MCVCNPLFAVIYVYYSDIEADIEDVVTLTKRAYQQVIDGRKENNRKKTKRGKTMMVMKLKQKGAFEAQPGRDLTRGGPPGLLLSQHSLEPEQAGID